MSLWAHTQDPASYWTMNEADEIRAWQTQWGLRLSTETISQVAPARLKTPNPVIDVDRTRAIQAMEYGSEITIRFFGV